MAPGLQRLEEEWWGIPRETARDGLGRHRTVPTHRGTGAQVLVVVPQPVALWAPVRAGPGLGMGLLPRRVCCGHHRAPKLS